MQVVELCRDLLKSLPRDIAKQVSIVCADVDTALEASNSLDNSIFALDDDIDARQVSRILLLAAPTLQQVSLRLRRVLSFLSVQGLLHACILAMFWGWVASKSDVRWLVCPFPGHLMKLMQMLVNNAAHGLRDGMAQIY